MNIQITGINWRMTRWWRAFSVSHCFGLALVVFTNAIFFHVFFFPERGRGFKWNSSIRGLFQMSYAIESKNLFG